MPRAVCNNCLRPEKTCICRFIRPIANNIEIGILQHPDEVANAKGSAIIAKLSLQKSRHWILESLNAETPKSNAANSCLEGFLNWLAIPEPTYLLYPSTESDADNLEFISTSNLVQHTEKFRLLVIDASWRKSFKMMQINPQLACLPRISLEPRMISNYQIRKQKNEQSLSTVEAVYQLLSELESNEKKFQPLLDAFEAMQQQQLAYRGAK